MAGLTDIIVLVIVAGGAYYLISSGTLDAFIKTHLPQPTADTTGGTTTDTSATQPTDTTGGGGKSARNKSGAAPKKGTGHVAKGGGGKGDKGCYTDICGGRHHCTAGSPGCCCGAQAKCGSGCH